MLNKNRHLKAVNSRLAYSTQADHNKTFRALNLRDFLQRRDIGYSWFHKNTISMVIFDDGATKKTIFISGLKDCYRVRLDIYKLTDSKGDFIQRDFPHTTAIFLMTDLVKEGFLPKEYILGFAHE
jgi:hypothetical protein